VENDREIFLYEPFRCYRPVNMLTHFMNGTTSAEGLQGRLFAFGITSEMRKSSCLVATRLFGAVPPSCDCSRQHVIANTTREDHHVQHHGDSYNLTDSQRQKINLLTDKDQILWRNAQLVFRQQVEQVESEFNVRLCGH